MANVFEAGNISITQSNSLIRKKHYNNTKTEQNQGVIMRTR